jgi:hypothetical protein
MSSRGNVLADRTADVSRYRPFNLLVPSQVMPDNPARRRADRLRRIDL